MTSPISSIENFMLLLASICFSIYLFAFAFDSNSVAYLTTQHHRSSLKFYSPRCPQSSRSDLSAAVQILGVYQGSQAISG